MGAGGEALPAAVRPQGVAGVLPGAALHLHPDRPLRVPEVQEPPAATEDMLAERQAAMQRMWAEALEYSCCRCRLLQGAKMPCLAYSRKPSLCHCLTPMLARSKPRLPWFTLSCYPPTLNTNGIHLPPPLPPCPVIIGATLA